MFWLVLCRDIGCTEQPAAETWSGKSGKSGAERGCHLCAVAGGWVRPSVTAVPILCCLSPLPPPLPPSLSVSVPLALCFSFNSIPPSSSELDRFGLSSFSTQADTVIGQCPSGHRPFDPAREGSHDRDYRAASGVCRTAASTSPSSPRPGILLPPAAPDLASYGLEPKLPPPCALLLPSPLTDPSLRPSLMPVTVPFHPRGFIPKRTYFSIKGASCN